MLDVSSIALKAEITAPPEGGKANAAVIALLAEAWRLPKSSLSVLKGATSRDKTIAVAGDPVDLSQRIAQWMKTNA